MCEKNEKTKKKELLAKYDDWVKQGEKLLKELETAQERLEHNLENEFDEMHIIDEALAGSEYEDVCERYGRENVENCGENVVKYLKENGVEEGYEYFESEEEFEKEGEILVKRFEFLETVYEEVQDRFEKVEEAALTIGEIIEVEEEEGESPEGKFCFIHESVKGLEHHASDVYICYECNKKYTASEIGVFRTHYFDELRGFKKV